MLRNQLFGKKEGILARIEWLEKAVFKDDSNIKMTAGLKYAAGYVTMRIYGLSNNSSQKVA